MADVANTEAVSTFSILEDFSLVYGRVHLLTANDAEPTNGIYLKMSGQGAGDGIIQSSVIIFSCLKPYFFWSMLMLNFMAHGKHC